MASRKKRAKQAPKKHIIPFALLGVFLSVVLVGGVGIASAFAAASSWVNDLDPVSEMEALNVPQKTVLYARDGTTVLAEFYAEDREVVTVDQVNPLVFDATIAVEDERFYEHNGVDMLGIARAVVVDLMGGQEGASTITQQLVRQTILSEEATELTLERKAREIYLALEVEKQFSKEEILMMYLNTVNYGDGSYGIQSAAQHYFGKNATDLTLEEAALLVGIPQSPTYNNPVYYHDNAMVRRNQVLDRMLVNGYISQEQCDAAKQTPITLNVQEKPINGLFAAEYFSVYVRNLLEDQYGTSVVFNSGLRVITTLDINMQHEAEAVCAAKEATLDSDVEVGLTSIEPNTGYIRAMRGGKDFSVDQWSTATDMSRSPGSTFKMFALVACLERGYAPSTAVSGSSPITYGNWNVENYGGASYGMMTLATATHQSSNTAYVRVVRTIGADAIANTASRMGIQSPLTRVPSLVLGTSGVNTLEMASAYATLAAGGVYRTPLAIERIYDHNGEVIYESMPESGVIEGEQVISPQVAYAATNVLKGVMTSGTGTRAYLGYQDAAGKTGTSENWEDSWFCGYTPQLSTAIWIGAREKRYIPDNIGGSNACPVWKAFMNYALDYYDGADFPTSTNPTYDDELTFLTPEEIAAQEEADRLAQEEADRLAQEEADRLAQEEENNGTGDDPGETDPGDGDGGGGTDPTTPPVTTPTTPSVPHIRHSSRFR